MCCGRRCGWRGWREDAERGRRGEGEMGRWEGRGCWVWLGVWSSTQRHRDAEGAAETEGLTFGGWYYGDGCG
jgi:hypothetical protein